MADEFEFNGNGNSEEIVVDAPAELDEVFGNRNFVKNPEVFQSIVLEVAELRNDDKNINGRKVVNGKTVDFKRGFKDKKGEHKWDIHCVDGSIYTIPSVQLFYAIGNVLKEYAQKNPGRKPSYQGAKLKIEHLFDGSLADEKLPVLKAILSEAPYNWKDMTIEKAEAYQKEIQKAKAEYRLYNVTLVN